MIKCSHKASKVDQTWSNLNQTKASGRLPDNPRLTIHRLCNIHSSLGQRLWSRHTLFLDGGAAGYVEQQWRAIVAITTLLGKLTGKLHWSFKYHQISKGCSARRMINFAGSTFAKWNTHACVQSLTMRTRCVGKWSKCAYWVYWCMDGCILSVGSSVCLHACIYVSMHLGTNDSACWMCVCVRMCPPVSISILFFFMHHCIYMAV